jgi:hypothetical protein
VARRSNESQRNKQFLELIDALDVGDLQKRFLRSRWLDQVTWFEGKAVYNKRRYYGLRIVVIIGGVTVPALVSLNVRETDVARSLAWVTFGLSLLVAVAAALEAFFGYGERWRTSRQTAEALKSHGWQFFELAGPYALRDHATAFPAFAAHVESLVQQDVEAFIAAQIKAAQAQATPPKAGD